MGWQVETVNTTTSGMNSSLRTIIETYMEDVLQVPVSRGYLAKLCTGLIADSLDTSYQELKDAIPQQEQLGSDETGFKNNGKKHWIWCIASAIFTVFHIAPTRSRKVLEELVAEKFAGYLNFEYFSANCSFAILLQQRRPRILLRVSQSANTSWKAATKSSRTTCLRTTSVLCLQTASSQPIITTNNKSTIA